jgi:predicted hydrocarbon binding protein
MELSNYYPFRILPEFPAEDNVFAMDVIVEYVNKEQLTNLIGEIVKHLVEKRVVILKVDISEPSSGKVLLFFVVRTLAGFSKSLLINIIKDIDGVSIARESCSNGKILFPCSAYPPLLANRHVVCLPQGLFHTLFDTIDNMLSLKISPIILFETGYNIGAKMVEVYREFLPDSMRWGDIINQVGFLFMHQGSGVITKYNVRRGRISISIIDNPECNYIVTRGVEREPEFLKGFLRGMIEQMIHKTVESRFISKKVSDGKSVCVLDIYF